VRPLVVVGDVLLEIDLEGTTHRQCPDAPAPVVDVATRKHRAGGAGLAALLAAQDCVDVQLIAGFGADAAAERLMRTLGSVGLVRITLDGGTPCKTRIRANGHSVCRVDSGDGRVPNKPLDNQIRHALQNAGAVLVADYGRGMTHNTWIRRELSLLPREIPLVWDPHPNGAEPVERTDLVVPNRSEAGTFTGELNNPIAAANALRHRWGCEAVAVTLGAGGAILTPPEAGKTFAVPTRPENPHRFDACGAGDRFAAAATLALHRGAATADAVACAVEQASRFVAGGGASAWTVPDIHPATTRAPSSPFELAGSIRAQGGRLVAAGGCFDLLHPGHIQLLEQARGLGDFLVVCINGDASVRRLKGPARPVMTAEDRARVLGALQPVDAVAVFDEDTPCALLEALRPHVWVKGGDYRADELPEARILRRYGGQIVLLPLVDGHSSSRLLDSVRLPHQEGI
jgi:D-beta-D-heptose 7-phosphate kinase/D-beta-D-heptose 1-phosphate adenosyltransferase